MIEIIDEAQYDQNASSSKVKVRAAPGQTNAADKKKNGKKEKKEIFGLAWKGLERKAFGMKCAWCKRFLV